MPVLITQQAHCESWRTSRRPVENLLSESQSRLPWASGVSQIKILRQKNIWFFCSDGFLASLSHNFFNNFGTIFADKLTPTDALSSSRRITSGAGYICPRVTELLLEAESRFLLVTFLLDPAPLGPCLQFPIPRPRPPCSRGGCVG